MGEKTDNPPTGHSPENPGDFGPLPACIPLTAPFIEFPESVQPCNG
jgi:hypothetical protein